MTSGVSTREQTFPSTISHRVGDRNDQNGGMFQGFVHKMGEYLRNAFFLPLYQKNVEADSTLNQYLGAIIARTLKNGDAPCTEELALVRRYFSMRDIPVKLENSTISTIFTIRLFESKELINDKKLRIILFSFNGNLEGQRGAEVGRWEPRTMRELSETPLCILKALQANGVKVDSLVTTSLGNVTLDGLKHFSADRTAIPSTWIINRGLTSVKKVASQLFGQPFSTLLYVAAKWTGWDADPEQEMLNFLRNDSELERKGRKVIVIEALQDFYFSGKGQFEADFHTKIQNLGVAVFRASFYPFPFHIRAHHALALDHLVNNSLTHGKANAASFSLEKDEKLSSALAREIFLKGEEQTHTCFYICGNDATLDIGTAREVVPLLSAFIEEGQKMSVQESKIA
jgi:hypothetical protein